MVIARIRSVPHAEGLVYQPLAENPHSVFARASHPLARKRRVQLAELARQAWVLPPPGNVLRDSLAVIFTEHGLTLPTQDVETAALPVIVSLLREADMLSALADEVVHAELDAGVLVRLPVTLPLRLGAAGIVTRRDHRLPPAARALLETLRETAELGGGAVHWIDAMAFLSFSETPRKAPARERPPSYEPPPSRSSRKSSRSCPQNRSPSTT